jgi:pimeloyl-ACP methyl ester carboxylesterase
MDTWILLRGLTRCSAHWGRFVSEFESQPGVQAIALDLPGTGRLWKQRSPSSMDGLVQSVRGQLSALGVNTPVCVLGLSMGAMVGARWALQWPSEVRQLVLINTSTRPFSPFWQRLRPAGLLRLLRLVLVKAGPQAWEMEILRLTSNHPRDDVMPIWLTERELHPVSPGNALRQLRAAAAFTASATPPRANALVLASAGDRLVNPACSMALASAWETSILVHPTAGHDLTLDDAAWVVQAVQNWRVRALPHSVRQL